MKSRILCRLTALLLLATLTLAAAPAATAATVLETPALDVGGWWSGLVSFLQAFWASLSPDKDDVPPPSIGPWADPSG